MARTVASPKSVLRRQSPAVSRSMIDLCRQLAREWFGSYRPEQHYMRGPGPKWHAKHDTDDQILPPPSTKLH